MTEITRERIEEIAETARVMSITRAQVPLHIFLSPRQTSALCTLALKGLAMEWLTDLENAPRDGTQILIAGGTYTWDDDYPAGDHELKLTACVGWHEAFHKKGWATESREPIFWHSPTHWLPLPTPPEELK